MSSFYKHATNMLIIFPLNIRISTNHLNLIIYMQSIGFVHLTVGIEFPKTIAFCPTRYASKYFLQQSGIKLCYRYIHTLH